MCCWVLLLVVAACGAVVPSADQLSGTQLIYSQVVCRHGDRTPEETELAANKNGPQADDDWAPEGLGGLTNRGKRRARAIGEYMRNRYDGFLSKTYLTEEFLARTTYVDRTKMTALAALSALYPPEESQRWSDEIDWQPIPYTHESKYTDDLKAVVNCGKYSKLLREASGSAISRFFSVQYDDFLQLLSEYAGAPVTGPHDVVFVMGGLQAMGEPFPFHSDLWDVLKLIEGEAFRVFAQNTEMIRLSAGTVIDSFIKTIDAILSGEQVTPSKVLFMSTHDTNVASVMAAARVLQLHRPAFGATFSMDLRKNISSGEYGIALVHAADPETGLDEVLRMEGCGGRVVCPLETFRELTAEHRLDDYAIACNE